MLLFAARRAPRGQGRGVSLARHRGYSLGVRRYPSLDASGHVRVAHIIGSVGFSAEPTPPGARFSGHDSIQPGTAAARQLPRGHLAMKNSLLIAVGALLVIAGVVWGLQGLGYIGGSVMSGVTFWAVAGPLVALAGLAMAAVGVRRRSPR